MAEPVASERKSTLVSEEVILEANNLKKYFPVRGGILKRVVGFVKAVDGIDIEIRRGETLAL